MAVKAKDTATKVIKGAGNCPEGCGRPVTAVLKKRRIRLSRKDSRCIGPSGKKGGFPVVKVVDKASGAIKGIVGRIGKAARLWRYRWGLLRQPEQRPLGASVSAGMQLEQQQISTEHFVGATNKELSQADVKAQSQSYIHQLRENANATPLKPGKSSRLVQGPFHLLVEAPRTP